MSISIEFLSIVGMWAAQAFYFLCFLPQIITNYRRKSCAGLSEFFLFGYLNVYVAVLYYTFSCNLPFAYKVLCPLQAAAVLVIIFQRLYYDRSPVNKKYWFLYGGNVTGAMMLMPIDLYNPDRFGMIAGWVMFTLALINQLPQVVKIFKEKSVVGFSFGFVFLTTLAATTEFVTALFVGLPLQTLLSSLRGIVIGLVWMGQFWLYR